MLRRNIYASLKSNSLQSITVLGILLFSLCALILPLKASAAVNATLSLTPASSSLPQNNVLVMNLYLSSGGNSVEAWQADLNYPTALFSSVSVSIPSSSPFTSNPTTDTTTGGAINLARFTLTPTNYSGPIARITLTPKATGSGTITFTPVCDPSPDPCSAVTQSGTNVLASTNNASFSITAPSQVCGPSEPVLPYVLSYYNPRTYDHFYTPYQCETYTLVQKLGYQLDGTDFNTTDSSTPGAVIVWRLYNAATQQHLWTVSQADITAATQKGGYHVEGIAFYSAPSTASNAKIVWRLYNPKTYQHVWTTSQSSIDFVTQKLGFYVEGIAFYSQ